MSPRSLDKPLLPGAALLVAVPVVLTWLLTPAPVAAEQQERAGSRDRHPEAEQQREWGGRRWDRDDDDRRHRGDDDRGDHDRRQERDRRDWDRRYDHRHHHDRDRHRDFHYYGAYGPQWPSYRFGSQFVVPRQIHRHDRYYASFFVGLVFFPGHGHYHSSYLFPVWIAGGWGFRPHYYCDGALFQ
jgi:hypothetical protein